MAEAQGRTRSAHLHLKPDDTICDTGAGSARGTGKAAHHANRNSFRGGGNISKLLRNSNLISSMVLTALPSPFMAVWGSSRQPQKGSGEGAGCPQSHHSPCQKQTFLSILVFPADPSSLPAGTAVPTSTGNSFLTARDTIHGF